MLDVIMLTNAKGNEKSNPSTYIKYDDDNKGFSKIFQRQMDAQYNKLNTSKSPEKFSNKQDSSYSSQQNNLSMERYDARDKRSVEDNSLRGKNKIDTNAVEKNEKLPQNNVDEVELKEENIMENPLTEDIIRILEELMELLQDEEEDVDISAVENLVIQLQQLIDLNNEDFDLEGINDILQVIEVKDDNKEGYIQKLDNLLDEVKESLQPLEKEEFVISKDTTKEQNKETYNIEKSKDYTETLKEDAAEEKAIDPEKKVVQKLADDYKNIMSTETESVTEANDVKEEGIRLINDLKTNDVSFNNTTLYTKEINSKNILEQVVHKIDAIYKSGKNQLSLQLNPENLGKLSIKLISENNDIKARVYVESLQVKEVIESNFNQLRDSLKEKGISIGGLEVSVGDDKEDFQQHRSLYKNKLKSKVGRVSINNGIDGVEMMDSRIAKNPYVLASSFDKLI